MKSRLSILLASIGVTALLALFAFHQRRVGRNPPPLNQSRIKSARSYWTWRILVPLAYAAAVCGAVLACATRDARLFVCIVVCLVPLLAVTVFASFTAEAFSFDYSVFGKYPRTPLPTQKPHYEVPFSYAIIGKVRTGPTVTWQFHAHGVAIRIATIGDVFIPLEEIDALELRRGFLVLTSELTHHCPEVRTPIAVPNGVAKIMAHCYPDKVLVGAKRV